ncbi:putative gamma interferon inducible lysosomal thiol reductase GILT [Helianthus annuus]|uniref:Gamma interferon inducible lysosomal thiol reductase GILT n=1 Tax=Helianthus annuus TaxID=4232 RepID=A0A251VP42_HELAN|nr:gamma-interferon-responsive lysosomal thiol protein [Helianthus annuus]KAF5821680.1 putative gamma interferon inducible lysosomal thiol reductase GILT [Helianthus annuus]KAJ0611324.1 putative gamma interferon inducible lysosomal thiol reductase GILT [Helianthus annuus]KAJ0622324.1 putative gamma interferon inducible lysosomal thiol reductase GILT [Helianthus annuus]KAJ0626598.1 putative gamma interferon inducible lysosomal thiol reductase GILT [Helianthus annuus]KAJ0947624.1 putative gamma 
MEAHLHRSKNVIVLLVLSVSLAATLVQSSATPVAGEKVKLALYYEALCPGCTYFILNDLSKIFDNGLIDIVDLKLSPYGNAKISSNGTIVCQHGEWECKLNTVGACAINTWPNVNDHFKFIHCVESLSDDGKYREWKTCFKKLKLDPKQVTECFTGELGHKLELQYADEIGALKPPHEYVPWVVVDGKPLKEDFANFVSYVCKAYKGSKVPQACRGLSLKKDSAKPFNNVCYKEDNNAKSKVLESM